MSRFAQLTKSLYSKALSVARRCRPYPSNTIPEEASHEETAGTSSPVITRSSSPQSQPTHSPPVLVDCQPSSSCHYQNSAPSDVNPNAFTSDSPCPSHIVDFPSRPNSPTSFQRPTSPTPITSRAHDLIAEGDDSSLYHSILAEWNNEDEHVRVRWYMADRYQKDTWEQERVRDPDSVVAAAEASPYQYIVDAWSDEDDDVQARWYLQDKCQKDAWERACSEAELKESVPFLTSSQTITRSPSSFSLQSPHDILEHAKDGRESLASGLVATSDICIIVKNSKLHDEAQTATGTGSEHIMPSSEVSALVA